ncbi:site-specific DNA-methyltransferase [Anaerobiospirillum succiniciproducens]|uniref:site-specific DNA-methyltransferase n=1 Tax=Anaerobiospirillum succiniciproducens TaxID=13335 RepID=UPI0023539C77|nr:site-specific DNA-methyltransferase [Anaerobiospirillum succiniciproducens]MCI6864407.1 site-specific DNA-methyltransferase [Anaerobiospirillum succiniciproducens]
MEMLKMHSGNAFDSNIEALAQLFPDCIVEAIDDNGLVVKAVDFEQLKGRLQNFGAIDAKERFGFMWPDKSEARRLCSIKTSDALRPCRDQSVEFDSTENLYIEGDNLQVLKVLRNSYAGKVDMIYIDPPYNTGKDFIYVDDFKLDADSYSQVSGDYDELGNRLVLNSSTEGRYHTSWLNMIYPRLFVSRFLLSDTGVIFIAIDDKEFAHLKLCCNEVFGESNFVGTIILKTATDNNPTQIVTEHEYCLCYAKNKSKLEAWGTKSEAAKLIENEYFRLKKETQDTNAIQAGIRDYIKKNSKALEGVTHYNYVDTKGVYSASTNSADTKPGKYRYDILHPITKLPCPTPANGWRWPKETFDAYDAAGDVHWGEDHTTQPHVKKRIDTVISRCRSVYSEDGRGSTKRLADLLGFKNIFDNPKSDTFIKKILQFAVPNKDGIVMDFFGGSSTTADALMQVNAEDNGHRKFILVQIPEHTLDNSPAYKAGFKNICEIGKERIRRAGAKIKAELGDKAKELDIGFRVLKLDSSNMEDAFYLPHEMSLESLISDNIKPDRTSEDLLFQTMLETDVLLSSSIGVEHINNKEVFVVRDGYLMACFDEHIDLATVKAIAERKPAYFITRDGSLASDDVADNMEQIFMAISPNTTIKVL